MGTHYYVYAEVKVNDRWCNLNPIVKKKNGDLIVCPIYDCGSSFYEICNDLEERATGAGIPDDMSPELRSAFRENLDETYDGWIKGTTWRQIYQQSVFCVPYSEGIAPRILKNRANKYEGYVSKRTIADFEVHEIDEINEWLTEDEYKTLQEAQKKQYCFYQWDEEYDEYQVYRTIYERLCAVLYWADFADVFAGSPKYCQGIPGLSGIRLFVERA